LIDEGFAFCYPVPDHQPAFPKTRIMTSKDQSMETISRRNFTLSLLNSALSLSLIEGLCRMQALGGSVKPLAHRWLVDLQEMSRDLKKQKIKPLEWQNKIDELFARVELSDILKATNFDKLARKVRWTDNHEWADDIKFPKVAGLAKEYVFVPLFVAMRKDRPVVPHGHSNMATMHMVLKGDIHLRQYDRVEDEAKHLLIKPTIDRACKPGELSSISDEKNNLHWFCPTSDVAFAFNIGLYGINPDKNITGRDYIDPDGGEKLAGGLLRVRRLQQDEAYRLYSKT
jgi:hypothetical protein